MLTAGFVDFEITSRQDVFGGAPQAGSAASFGTMGITFRARKPASQEEQAALAALTCYLSQEAAPTSLFGAAFFYDAGDAGCAFGPLNEIAALMRRMNPGQTLEVRATDPTVAVDLPAWCRLVGHRLIAREGHRYLIERS